MTTALAVIGAFLLVGLVTIGIDAIIQGFMDARRSDRPNEDDEDWPSYRSDR